MEDAKVTYGHGTKKVGFLTSFEFVWRRQLQAFKTGASAVATY
jgi:hypothetical protein